MSKMAIINLRRPTDSPMCVVKLRNTAMQWHDRHEYISAMSFLEEVCQLMSVALASPYPFHRPLL